MARRGIERIGVFGIFNGAAFRAVTDKMYADWLALEEIAYEHDWWAGIYSGFNLIEYGKHRRLLKTEEYDNWLRLLQA